MYTREFVLEFAQLVRGNPMETIDELFDRFFECYEQPEPAPEPQNIFLNVLISATERCNVTMEELESGRKYGDIPTVKQLTSKVLSELEHSQEKIAKELPMLGKRNAVQKQITTATRYAVNNKKPFLNVLVQLREKFNVKESGNN